MFLPLSGPNHTEPSPCIRPTLRTRVQKTVPLSNRRISRELCGATFTFSGLICARVAKRPSEVNVYAAMCPGVPGVSLIRLPAFPWIEKLSGRTEVRASQKPDPRSSWPAGDQRCGGRPPCFFSGSCQTRFLLRDLPSMEHFTAHGV